MKVTFLAAVIALLVGGMIGCSSSDRDSDHRDIRDSGGAPTTRGGQRDDSTRLQTDPVCGMTVNPRTAITETYNGQNYYFDTKDCARKFRDNPQAYIPGADGQKKNQEVR